MFKNILVPLDGSRMAESALPLAARLAGAAGAGLTLVHVIERNAPRAVHSERHLVTREEAGAYLQEMTRRPELSGLSVRTHVHEAEVRDVAAAIAEHTTELAATDLIIMTTHGRGGARRLIFGAIAQQVIRMGRTPVMLAQEAPAAWDCRSVLAPIDRDPAHEQGLPAAAGLAGAFRCGLHLLMVTPHMVQLTGADRASSLLLPASTRFKLDLDNEAARKHVAERAAELCAAGVSATAETQRGDPARLIVKTARRLGSGIVVMGTHGRAGTDAFWEESVTARVVARLSAPLLLVPVADPDARRAARVTPS
jgi:nucleotide-binding universal stress UspA family protein